MSRASSAAKVLRKPTTVLSSTKGDKSCRTQLCRRDKIRSFPGDQYFIYRMQGGIHVLHAERSPVFPEPQKDDRPLGKVSPVYSGVNDGLGHGVKLKAVH